MPISDEHLDDFIKRWEHVFNETLTREEAQREAAKLVEFYKLVARPLPGSSTPPSDPASDQNVL